MTYPELQWYYRFELYNSFFGNELNYGQDKIKERMNYKEFKLFSKVVHNSITWDDFQEAGKSMGYNQEYIDTIWPRWCQGNLAFIAGHAMGESLYNMVLNKMEAEKILKNV